jgi:hypothetical protein
VVAARLAAALAALSRDPALGGRLARAAARAGGSYRAERALPAWDRLLRAAAARRVTGAAPRRLRIAEATR